MIEELFDNADITTTPDGVKFAIDVGGNLWIDALEGKRTGFWKMGDKKIGVYLSKEQVNDIMNAYKESI